MAASEGTWVVLGGIVQQFKKDGEYQPVVVTRDVNNGKVSSFKVKTFPGQKLVGISLWSELAHVAPHVVKGMFVAVEGKMTEETVNGVTYYNVSAQNINLVAPATRQERETVNESPAAAAPAEQQAAQPAAGGTIF